MVRISTTGNLQRERRHFLLLLEFGAVDVVDLGRVPERSLILGSRRSRNTQRQLIVRSRPRFRRVCAVRRLRFPAEAALQFDVTPKSLTTTMRTNFCPSETGKRTTTCWSSSLVSTSERKRFAVQFGLLHRCAQADGRTKFDGGLAGPRGTTRFQKNSFRDR